MCNGLRQFLRALGVTVLAMTLGHVAHAQLPRVQVPQLPRVDLPTTVTDTVNGVTGQVTNELGNVEKLADLRQLRIRDLLRTQRQFVERDPSGAPILRAEIVAFSPTEAALDGARAAGFTIARERNLEGLDARVVVLHAPERMSTRRALSRLRALDPNGAYDYNHIYLDSGVVDAPAPASAVSAGGNGPSAAMPSLKIGLVDGGIDINHPVFSGATIHTHGCNDKPVPSPHGTAVASLMIGRTDLFHGAAPGAELYAADVYCGVGTGGAVDAVVDAIAWIAREHVPVINVSLVGPRNITLENVVRVVIARGYIIVAAVGNDGAAAPPLYPASYPGVVGVTGVDARQKVILEACRGPQVDFAAPGADMAAAMLAPTFAAVRGTSFAAPIVAGLLAAQLHEPNAAAAEKAVSQLAQQAQDLGARGPDKVYGNGLVGNAVRTAPALALVGAAPGSRPN
jgi:subtilisin family serine protease